jgi:hypothetical protein
MPLRYEVVAHDRGDRDERGDRANGESAREGVPRVARQHHMWRDRGPTAGVDDENRADAAPRRHRVEPRGRGQTVRAPAAHEQERGWRDRAPAGERCYRQQNAGCEQRRRDAALG